VTDWSTDDPGGDGHYRYLAGEARSSAPYKI